MTRQNQNGNGKGRPRKGHSPHQRFTSRSGSLGRVCSVANVGDGYRRLSEADEAAADVLVESGHYRQAACMLIQAMEKAIQHGVFTQLPSLASCELVDEYRERVKTHNVDELLSVLLDVFRDAIGDARVSQQIDEQLEQLIVQGLRFHHLHNDVRYLRGHRSGQYTLLEIAPRDVQQLKRTLTRLRAFIDGFQLLRGSANELPQSPRTVEATPTERTDACSSPWTFRF